MKVVHKSQKSLQEKYPNDGVVESGEKSQVNPDNFFKDMEIDQVRQRYIKFTVYIEALYEVLGLERMASMEQFAFRVRDIVYAANVPEE